MIVLLFLYMIEYRVSLLFSCYTSVIYSALLWSPTNQLVQMQPQHGNCCEWWLSWPHSNIHNATIASDIEYVSTYIQDMHRPKSEMTTWLLTWRLRWDQDKKLFLKMKLRTWKSETRPRPRPRDYEKKPRCLGSKTSLSPKHPESVVYCQHSQCYNC